MVAVDVSVKRMFLDTKLVEGLIGKKSAAALRKAMSRIRLRAMHSMRKKGKARRPPKNQGGKAFLRWADEVQNQPVSAPGSPPFVHSDDSVRTLRNIWFALDNSSAVEIRGVVGPLKLNGNQGAVPSLMERGGSQKIRERRIGKHWIPVGRVNGSSSGRLTRVRTANYPARPFMQPAMTKEAPKLPSLWAARAE